MQSRGMGLRPRWDIMRQAFMLGTRALLWMQGPSWCVQSLRLRGCGGWQLADWRKHRCYSGMPTPS